MKKYYKETDGKKIWSYNSILFDDMRIFNPTDEQLKNSGYIEYTENSVAQEEEPIKDDIVSSSITKLSSEDYKIIKCMESFLCGEEMPYDINTLHAERNMLRDLINNLTQTE